MWLPKLVEREKILQKLKSISIWVMLYSLSFWLMKYAKMFVTFFRHSEHVRLNNKKLTTKYHKDL